MKYLFLLLISIAIATAVEPFTIVVKTDNPGVSAGNQFQLPLASTAVYNFTVDWGDGQSDVITTSTSPTHTYATVGTKTIQITENVVGGFPQIFFVNRGDCKKLLQISRWGGGTWSSMECAFYGCSNLTISATDAVTALTGTVTNFHLAWSGCSGLTSFPLLNTTAGTNFGGAWNLCSGLTSFPLLNTSAGTSFWGTWDTCSGLTNFPLLDTAAGTSFIAAWWGCSGLTSFPTLNLGNMLYGDRCFYGATLPIDSYSALLENLAALNANTNVVFSGGNSKYRASALSSRNTLTSGRSWTITDGGPASATAVEPFAIVVKTDNPGVSASNQFQLPLANTAAYNFTVDWGDGIIQFVNTPGSPTHTYATVGTKTIRITENVVGGFPQLYFNNGGDRLKVMQISNWGGGTWSSMQNAFSGCSNLTITAIDAATALTGTVTNFQNAWAYCSALTNFPLLNTSAGINFRGAWAYCSGMTSFPLLNTFAGTDFTSTWANCTGLTSIPALNLRNMRFGPECFAGVRLSVDSYSALLINLAATNTNTGVTFSGSSGYYNASAVAARNTLTLGRGWQIYDGGLQLTNPFTIVVKTDNVNPGTSGSNQFFLPLYSGATYNFTVDWGDGSSQVVTTSVSPTHMYASVGTKTIRIMENIVGGFPRIYFAGREESQKLLQITQWGGGKWASMEYAFTNCYLLTITATDEATALTGAITNFDSAWSQCSSLSSFPLLNTAGGTSFSNTWYNCSGLVNFPHLNTAAGINFSNAWSGCFNLTSFPLLNTASGVNFSGAWYGCGGLTDFPLLNTTSGTEFGSAWRGCIRLTSFPLLNTASGTSFFWAWADCRSLTSFPLLNTGAGKEFGHAWDSCGRLTSFPLLNTVSGTSFIYSWYGCLSLNSFPLLNTAAGTNFYFAWSGCRGLNSFPLLNTAAGTEFTAAWSDCSRLTYFPLLNFESLINGNLCFSGVTLSVDSYSALLISIAALNFNANVTFNGGNSKFSSGSVSARDALTAGRNWTITDGGPAAATTLTWATPTAITYGTALTSAQLNASAGITGTYTYVPPSGTILGAGKQTLNVTFTPTEVINYASVTRLVTLTVNKAVLNVRAQDQSRAYGAENPAPTSTITGFFNGDTASVISGSAVLATTATATSPVTTYPITVNVSGMSAANYSFTGVAGRLTVGKAVLTVTANNVSRAFGAANPVLTSTITGFQNGDTASVISGSPVLATTVTASSSVTTYPITVNVLGMSAANYSFSGVSGILSITQATPIVTWAIPAAITYGVPLSATQLNATASVAGSLVYTPRLDTLLHVGGGQTLSVAFTPTDTLNYTTANATTLLTVNKAPLILTAANKSMVSGQAVPTLTAVGSGFVSPDTLTSLDTAPVLTTTATASSAVGTCPIVVSGASDADYAISYINGTMTVTAGGGGGGGSGGGKGGKCGLGSGFGAAALVLMLALRLVLVRRREKFFA